MQLGIGTYAFAWSIGMAGYQPETPFSAHQFLQKAKSLGARCVQIADNLPLHLLSQKDLSDLKQLAGKLDLSIEVGARGMRPMHLETYLEITKNLDASILRFVIDDHDYEPALSEVIALVKDAIPLLKQHNIRLAIENHDRLKAAQFLEIIEQTDDQWVGICLDSVNSLGADEGFAKVSELLIPHTLNVHLKDYQIKRKAHNMGFEVKGTPAGQGMLPIPSLLNQLIAIGKCKSAILELWPPPESLLSATIEKEHKWVQSSMDYLNPLFESLRHGQT